MDKEEKSYVTQTFLARAESYNGESHWVTSSDFVSPMVPEMLFGSSVALDVCSGTGVIARALAQKGWMVTCADSSEAMLKKSGACWRVVADMHHLPFEDSTFDLATLRQGLQYGDIRHCICEMKRVTRSEIRFGHITMIDGSDMEMSWWLAYFKIASPGRKTVFYPGQIESAGRDVGLKVSDVKVLYAMDSLLGPIAHLSEEARTHVRSTWEKAPSWFVQKYRMERLDSGDFLYAHRWEFITFQVPK